MKKIRETRGTKQFELLNVKGEVVQKVCRNCQRVKLIDEFPRYTAGHYRPDCKICHKKKRRIYYNKITDERAVYKQRERARKIGAPDNYLLNDYMKLKEFANGYCMICGVKADKLQIDHFQALSKGWLGSTKENIILVCEDVNQAKRDLSIFEFIKSDRSKGLIDRKQLTRTIYYLANICGLSITQYISMLQYMEELATKSKDLWR